MPENRPSTIGPEAELPVARARTRLKPTRVLVIGAQGVLGGAVARRLCEAGWQVTRGGRRSESSADFQLVDLDRPDGLEEVFPAYDLVVSTVPHRRLTAERIVLREGGTLINLSTLRSEDLQSLESEAKVAKGLVIVHAGIAPGVVTLVAVDLLRKHPDADTVEIALTLSASGASGRSGREFAHRLLTDKLHHPVDQIPLPAPFGIRRCLRVDLSTEGWLRSSSKGRREHLNICFSEPFLNNLLLWLNRLRLISFLPKAVFRFGRRSTPPELTTEPICEWVSVAREGKRLAACTIEGKGDYRSTVAAALVFVDAVTEKLCTGDAVDGVFGVEDLFTLDGLRSDLEAKGICIRNR